MKIAVPGKTLAIFEIWGYTILKFETRKGNFMRNELIALRQAMAAAKVDVYVIPTDDFHGSEYVGDYFQCRSYVSGFTGSAGTLVVTADWAGLWTDGRYFLQAAQELEGSGIDLCKMGQPGVPTISAWLKENLKKGQTLGFDGRAMTIGTGTQYAEAAATAGAELSFNLDLVGEIWPERPPMSTAPVWELDVQYAGRTRGDKLETLKKDLKKQGADTFILTSLDDIAWLLNIRGDDVECCPVVLANIMVDQNGVRLYTDESKYPAALRERLAVDGVTFCPYLNIYEDVKKIAAGSTVLVDPSKVSYALRKNIPAEAAVVEGVNPTTISKGVKTQAEQDNERLAHIKDGVALTRFMKWIKEHVGKETITEISAAEKLESFRSQMEHYLGPSFDPIMGYGPHGAIIHYSATEESDIPMAAEGFLLADTGGHYLEGSTDVTRTFVLGPLTEEMKYHYTLVLRSHLDLAAAVFPTGCRGSALDYIARKPFWDVGLDYNHGTGHGVGYLLSVHEGPQNINYHGSRNGGPEASIDAGMITSDEPGFYLEGKYGIRLENLTLCVERDENEYGRFLGFEPLTMCPFELDAINVEELSEVQRKQLNAYHETIYQNLAPYFDDEEKAWLRNATRPI